VTRGAWATRYQRRRRLRVRDLPMAFGARKENSACCLSRRDEYGRFPIGWCGPDCERRPENRA